MSGPEKLPDEFHEARRVFRAIMERHGMDKEATSYCISIARRLEKIYAESEQVATLEDETVAALRNVLHRLPPKRHYDTETATAHDAYWECVPGGLCEGDGYVLHIVPPGCNPIGVPTPHGTQAVREAEADAATGVVSYVSQVQRTLEAWERPAPEPEPASSVRDQPEPQWSIAQPAIAWDSVTAQMLQDWYQEFHTQSAQAMRRMMADDRTRLAEQARQRAIEQAYQRTITMPSYRTLSEQGYKQLQEISEKRKRKGRNAK